MYILIEIQVKNSIGICRNGIKKDVLIYEKEFTFQYKCKSTKLFINSRTYLFFHFISFFFSFSLSLFLFNAFRCCAAVMVGYSAISISEYIDICACHSCGPNCHEYIHYNAVASCLWKHMKWIRNDEMTNKKKKKISKCGSVVVTDDGHIYWYNESDSH